jgi:hypothetical protein
VENDPVEPTVTHTSPWLSLRREHHKLLTGGQARSRSVMPNLLPPMPVDMPGFEELLTTARQAGSEFVKKSN